MAGLFDSAWLKWGRAVVHAHNLYDQLNALALQGEHLCETRTEYDAKRHCLSTRIVSMTDLPPALSLTLGDVAHNYRSCLDHIAWALVGRGRRPPATLTKSQIGGVYFPICAELTIFNDCLDSASSPRRRPKLPGVRRADIAIVRRYQPYMTCKRRRHLHVFTALDSLSREDKHRAIRPVLAVPQSSVVYVGEPRDCTITVIPEGMRAHPLEINTEIHRVYVRKTGPNPGMQVEPHLSAEPAITPEIPVHEWLTNTRSFTCQLLREFSDPPVSELKAIGGHVDDPLAVRIIMTAPRSHEHLLAMLAFVV